MTSLVKNPPFLMNYGYKNVTLTKKNRKIFQAAVLKRNECHFFSASCFLVNNSKTTRSFIYFSNFDFLKFLPLKQKQEEKIKNKYAQIFDVFHYIHRFIKRKQPTICKQRIMIVPVTVLIFVNIKEKK